MPIGVTGIIGVAFTAPTTGPQRGQGSAGRLLEDLVGPGARHAGRVAVRHVGAAFVGLVDDHVDQAHGHDDGWKPASSGRPSTWDAMSATTAAPMYPGGVRPALRHWLEKARTARPCSRCAPAHISTETNPAAGTGPEPTSSKAARHPGGHPAPCADLPDHTLSISHARRALMGIHGK